MKLKVLVVDDQLQHNKIGFEAFLDYDEFEVVYAESKEHFLSLNIKEFSVVLLDINTDQWKLLFVNSLEKIKNDAPIILTSTRMHDGSTLVRIQESLSDEKNVHISSVLDLNPLLNMDLTNDARINLIKSYQTIISIASNKKKSDVINDDQEINILHISDPQYGDPHFDDWSIFLEKEIGRFIREEGMKIDFLVISGDIAYSGRREEYEVALRKLKKLVIQITKLPEKFAIDRILLVPGNHDVDFRFSSIPNTSVSFGNDKVNVSPVEKLSDMVGSDYSMLPFRWFAYELTNDENWLRKSELCWVNNSFILNGLRFIVFNTAEYINSESPCAPRVFEKTLSDLSTDAHLDERSYFNIFISHHGPIDPDYPGTVESVDKDWKILAPFLKESNVKLWLHGHGHARLTIPFPYKPISVNELSDIKASLKPSTKGANQLDTGQFIRVMAPTTHLDEHLRAKNERKGFNIIKLIRKNRVVKYVEVVHFAAEETLIEEMDSNTVKFKIK